MSETSNLPTSVSFKLTTATIKSLGLKQERLFIEAVTLLAQAQEIASRNPDLVRFEQDFALKVGKMREAMAKEAA